MDFWSGVMAFILGVSAIISPIATAIINNHYELEKQKLEVSSKQKCEALKSFSTNALHYYGDTLTYEKMCNYQNSLNNLYLYFSSIDETHFNMLDSFRKSNNIEDYKLTIHNIVVDLSKQITKE